MVARMALVLTVLMALCGARGEWCPGGWRCRVFWHAPAEQLINSSDVSLNGVAVVHLWGAGGGGSSASGGVGSFVSATLRLDGDQLLLRLFVGMGGRGATLAAPGAHGDDSDLVGSCARACGGAGAWSAAARGQRAGCGGGATLLVLPNATIVAAGGGGAGLQAVLSPLLSDGGAGECSAGPSPDLCRVRDGLQSADGASTRGFGGCAPPAAAAVS
jgi:hypothetical protein